MKPHQTSFTDPTGMLAVRTDVVTEDYTAHQLALYQEDGDPFGLYSEDEPLNHFLVLFEPHEPAEVWRRTSSDDICEEIEDYVTAESGRQTLAYWDLARRASMAPSLPDPA